MPRSCFVMSLESSKAFLSLVRLGLGHDSNTVGAIEVQPNQTDWRGIQDLAKSQGLYAIVLDGVERLPENKRPPKGLLLEWIGEVLHRYEYMYGEYRCAIAGMAGLYNAHGIKMMILKGYGLGMNYPNPKHRPCGDIDIWTYGKQKESDAILSKEKGIKIDNSHRHHTVFEWYGFTVENHYDMMTVDANRTNMILEPIMKELAMDDSNCIEIEGERVYLPSANFNALFLLRHMLMHFVSTDMNLRQLTDWAFFWEKHGIEVDVDWLYALLEKHHMKAFFNIVNSICVEDLGFQSSVFPDTPQCDSNTKDRVVREVLYPEFDWRRAHDKNVIERVSFKYKRWKGGAWKRDLCCSEGPLESFLWSARSHLLKPSSI